MWIFTNETCWNSVLLKEPYISVSFSFCIYTLLLHSGLPLINAVQLAVSETADFFFFTSGIDGSLSALENTFSTRDEESLIKQVQGHVDLFSLTLWGIGFQMEPLLLQTGCRKLEKRQKKEATAVGKMVSSFIWTTPQHTQHTRRSLKQVLAEKHVAVHDHPHYSPDLALFSFPCNQVCTEGNPFQVCSRSEEENHWASETLNCTALISGRPECSRM